MSHLAGPSGPVIGSSVSKSLTSRATFSRGLRRRAVFGPGSLTDEQIETLHAVRDLAPRAAEVLAELMDDGPPRVRLACVQEVMDRTYGRSERTGSVQVTHRTEGAPQAPDDQEEMLVAALAAVRARKADQALVVDAEESGSDHP